MRKVRAGEKTIDGKEEKTIEKSKRGRENDREKVRERENN